MEKKIKKKWLLTMACALTSAFTYANCCADSCIVLNTNSSEIKIGNRNAKIGLMFDDRTDPVTWTGKNDQEELTVGYVTDKGVVKGAKDFKAADFPKSRLVYISHASTKGSGTDDDDSISDQPFDSVQYLLKGLAIPRKEKTPAANIVAFAEIYSRNDTIARQISISADGTEYLVPREAFGIEVSKPVFLDILETDLDKNWQYAVWRKLYVVPLPLKID